jgi:hypothetical protein
MKKNILMLAGLTLVFSFAVACFTPGSKKDKSAPAKETTEEVNESAAEN